jgi:hypothetical protein
MKNDETDNNIKNTPDKLTVAATPPSAAQGQSHAAKKRTPRPKQKKSKWEKLIEKEHFRWVLGIVGSIVLLVGSSFVFIYEHQPSINVLDVPFHISQDGMQFEVRIQNGSASEATSFLAKCDSFVNEKSFIELGGKDITVPAKPVEIGGNAIRFICGGGLSPQFTDEIDAGKSTLRVYVHFTYKGFFWHYSQCDKRQYLPKFKTFADLGPCDASKPFPQ